VLVAANGGYIEARGDLPVRTPKSVCTGEDQQHHKQKQECFGPL